jgi:ABC-type transporter Mla MlaB component
LEENEINERSICRELSLKGRLTLQHIFNLKAELGAALNKVDRLIIDLGEAEEVDLSFLQLLCSVHRTAIALNKSLALAGKHPKEFTQILKGSGFIRHVGCAMDCNQNCIWRGSEFEKPI